MKGALVLRRVATSMTLWWAGKNALISNLANEGRGIFCVGNYPQKAIYMRNALDYSNLCWQKPFLY
jgi:hypothetical protein